MSYAFLLLISLISKRERKQWNLHSQDVYNEESSPLNPGRIVLDERHNNSKWQFPERAALAQWGGDFVMVMAVLWADSLADLCFLGSGWCAAGRTRLYRNTRAEQVVAGGRAARCCHPSTFPPWELQGKKPNGKIPTLQPSSGEKSSKAVLSSPNNLPSGVVSGWPHKTLGS